MREVSPTRMSRLLKQSASSFDAIDYRCKDRKKKHGESRGDIGAI